MDRLDRPALLKALGAEIARIEDRPVLGRTGTAAALRARMDAAGDKGTGERDAFRPWRDAPAGLLHDVWVDHTTHAAAGLSFALDQARRLTRPDRPAILWLQPAGEARETGLVYGAGLAFLGLDPDRVVIARIGQVSDLLWAAEEAIACRAVAAVIADLSGPISALDFTAARRLALRARTGGVSAFMLRYGTERPASAAFMRWRIAPAPSAEMAFDTRGIGAARLSASLERSGAGLRGSWLLEWSDGGFGLAGRPERGRGLAPRPAPYGAVAAALGDRLPQTA